MQHDTIAKGYTQNSGYYRNYGVVAIADVLVVNMVVFLLLKFQSFFVFFWSCIFITFVGGGLA